MCVVNRIKIYLHMITVLTVAFSGYLPRHAAYIHDPYGSLTMEKETMIASVLVVIDHRLHVFLL
jgi:hypothetical protein